MKDLLTNENKILFPKNKITKKDIFNYYKKIYKKIIPLIKDRPITLKRFPEGINGIKFYQKNVSKFFPKWLKTVKVKTEKNTFINMVVINDLKSLLYISNLVSEIHIWLSKTDKLNYPDKMIFDLDASEKKFAKVKEAALDLKKILNSLKLQPYLMTTGSKGLHLIVPIKREKNFDEVREIAKNIAEILVSKNIKKYTTEVRKNKRKGKVFIDYLRNSYAQTTIAPYSIRAIENAPVAYVLDFKKLKNLKSSQDFNINNIKTFLKIPTKSFSLKLVSSILKK
ncbi:MAG: hypothetical protein A3F40_01920 [Chlamydiae bacterium RIFCSPHIGHO2_12_FULL_27_8]|nr:MAG: hypothetical protein A3F40_01920 [Chlamydiae bacterium RIFCSPHIGHO2_12_FULL_27_8]